MPDDCVGPSPNTGPGEAQPLGVADFASRRIKALVIRSSSLPRRVSRYWPCLRQRRPRASGGAAPGRQKRPAHDEWEPLGAVSRRRGI